MLPAPIERALGALASQLPDLRRAQSGGASLEVALGRVERPEMASADVIEGSHLRAIAVPLPAGPTVRAFLDGIQESREVAWIGTVPVVLGRVAAVVRERDGASLRTWESPLRREALYAPWARLPRRVRALVEEFGPEAREVSTDDGGHPLRAMQDATNAVKQDREALERTLAEQYCGAGPGPLYVDGPLPPGDAVLGSDQVMGVIKSHQTMYVSGPALETVLALAEGERTTAFLIESRHRPPVASWYLRVRATVGHGPFWGLVRIEVPRWVFEDGGPAVADERSQWVLAERAPLALPDGRWDTMAYGVRSCEEYLRAVMG